MHVKSVPLRINVQSSFEGIFKEKLFYALCFCEANVSQDYNATLKLSTSDLDKPER